MSTKAVKQSAKRWSTKFADLKKIYGLNTPEQIKQRLIWNNMQLLIRQTFGESSHNKKLLQVMDDRFLACEGEEWRIAHSNSTRKKD